VPGSVLFVTPGAWGIRHLAMLECVESESVSVVSTPALIACFIARCHAELSVERPTAFLASVTSSTRFFGASGTTGFPCQISFRRLASQSHAS
jgi:hypothetical protein